MTIFDQITILIFVSCVGIELSLLLIVKYKKKFKQVVFAMLALFIILQSTLIYGSLIEPQWIEIVYDSVDLTEDQDGLSLKVVLVSDYHLGPYKQQDFVEKSVELINEQKPDLVLLLGDFIYSYEEQSDYLSPIANIKSKLGVYAILGNHDYGLSRSNRNDREEIGALNKSSYVANKLEEFGVEVLQNQQYTLNINGQDLVLVGLEDLWGDIYDFGSVFENLTSEDKIILLEHNPDIILDERSDIADLIVSGHTHGGQIRFPLIGTVYPIPTKLGAQYAMGKFDIEDGGYLYITKGIGEMGPRARLLARPEIVVLDVKL
jgi:hypothetical protein